MNPVPSQFTRHDTAELIGSENQSRTFLLRQCKKTFCPVVGLGDLSLALSVQETDLQLRTLFLQDPEIMFRIR